MNIAPYQALGAFAPIECYRTHIAVSKPRAPTNVQRVHKGTHNPPDMKFSLEAGLILNDERSSF